MRDTVLAAVRLGSRETVEVLPVPRAMPFLYKRQEGAVPGLARLWACRAALPTGVCNLCDPLARGFMDQLWLRPTSPLPHK